MKIHDGFESIDVYAVYWMNNKTLFLGHSSSYPGLLAYSAKDVRIIDPNLDGSFIYFNEGLFYRPLIDGNLLDDLLEADPAAYEKFLYLINNK